MTAAASPLVLIVDDVADTRRPDASRSGTADIAWSRPHRRGGDRATPSSAPTWSYSTCACRVSQGSTLLGPCRPDRAIAGTVLLAARLRPGRGGTLRRSTPEQTRSKASRSTSRPSSNNPAARQPTPAVDWPGAARSNDQRRADARPGAHELSLRSARSAELPSQSLATGGWAARLARRPPPARSGRSSGCSACTGWTAPAGPSRVPSSDRWQQSDPRHRTDGVTLPFAMALLEYDLDPQQLALDVGSGHG